MVGHCYATLSEGTSNTWLTVMIKMITYKMDHLMRVETGKKLKWKHPFKLDLLNLRLGLILDCKIDW